MALFLERAAAAGAALEPGTALLADVAELCRRLDGLPLAIELAAARTRSIAPGDLLGVVDQRLDVLRRNRGAGDRHDSMRAAIELSTSLLNSGRAPLLPAPRRVHGPVRPGARHGRRRRCRPRTG